MIPGLDTAELIEEYTEEKKIAVKAHNPAADKKTEKKEGEGEEKKEGDGDAKMEDAKQPEQQFETKQVQKSRATAINFKWEKHGLTGSQIGDLTKREHEMFKQDLSILEVKVARNNLETYVYDNRAQLDTYGDRAKYMKDDEREAFLNTLNETESWIYGDGQHASKNQYEDKLAALKATGEPVQKRYRFHDLYPQKSEQLNSALTSCFESAVQIPEDSHITKEEKEELLKLIEETTQWFNKVKEDQGKL